MFFAVLFYQLNQSILCLPFVLVCEKGYCVCPIDKLFYCCHRYLIHGACNSLTSCAKIETAASSESFVKLPLGIKTRLACKSKLTLSMMVPFLKYSFNNSSSVQSSFR